MVNLLRISLCILLISGPYLASGSEEEDDKSDKNIFKVLVGITKDVFKQGSEAWSAYEKIHKYLTPDSDYEIKDNEQRTKLLRQEVLKLVDDVHDLKKEVHHRFDLLEKSQSLTDRLNDIGEYLTKLSNLHQSFQKVVSESSPMAVNEIEQFAMAVTDPTNGVNGLLNHIKNFYLSTEVDGKTVFEYFTDTRLKRSFMCPTSRSAQQNIYHFYQQVLKHEIYGYMMNLLGHRLNLEFDREKRVYTDQQVNEKIVQGEIISRKEFNDRMNLIFEAAKRAMNAASRDIWKCDPSQHVEGETYLRFGPIFQKFIMYKNDFLSNNERLSGGVLGKTCASIKDAQQIQCTGEICTKERKCTGYVRECEATNTKLTVCPANDGYRRYQYILIGEGQVLGPNQNCKDATKLVHADGSLIYPYCMCTCEEPNMIRNAFINLQPVESDVHENKVVTGMKFYNEDNVFYILIQQGQLGPYGQINGTTQWKAIHTYRPLKDSVSKNVDYARIDWGSRTIHLTDRDSRDGKYVVTGLKFVKDKGTISLAVQYSKFDFNTGKVEAGSSRWDSEIKKIANTDLSDSDVPINFNNNMPNSEPGQYLDITTSSLNKDAGQNVIPFIDVQAVITNPPGPLSGAGLHLRSEKYSAGFLALKVFTYDIEPHLKSHQPSLENKA